MGNERPSVESSRSLVRIQAELLINQMEKSTKEIIKEIFNEIDRYDTRYGIAMPIQAYIKIRKKFMPNEAYG